MLGKLLENETEKKKREEAEAKIKEKNASDPWHLGDEPSQWDVGASFVWNLHKRVKHYKDSVEAMSQEQRTNFYGNSGLKKLAHLAFDDIVDKFKNDKYLESFRDGTIQLLFTGLNKTITDKTAPTIVQFEEAMNDIITDNVPKNIDKVKNALDTFLQESIREVKKVKDDSIGDLKKILYQFLAFLTAIFLLHHIIPYAVGKQTKKSKIKNRKTKSRKTKSKKSRKTKSRNKKKRKKSG